MLVLSICEGSDFPDYFNILYIAADDNFKFCCFYKNDKEGMIFHEKHLLEYLIIPYYFRKLGKMSQNLLSAAVVIGALRAMFSQFAYDLSHSFIVKTTYPLLHLQILSKLSALEVGYISLQGARCMFLDRAGMRDCIGPIR